MFVSAICGPLCNKANSLTTYSDSSVAFSDTGDSYIKAYNPTVKQCSVIVGKGKGTRDGSKAQFSQPKGICFDYGTLFTIDTSTGTLRMTSSVTNLVDYLKHLHLFGEMFRLHATGKQLGHSRDPPGNRETRASLFL